MIFRLARFPALLALTIAVAALAVGPRALGTRDPHAPRSHARRPRVPRHVLPERVVRDGVERSCRKVFPKREPADVDRHRAEPRALPSLPARVTVRLTAPDYLLRYENPQRQTSPPA
jgi:hypothetical protein